MSDRGIATKEKVWDAADKLFAQGTIVTQEKIRKEINGGSYNTIGKYLREWKDREDNDTPAKNYPMPDWAKKIFEESSQAQWNNFCRKYELIIDNERIDELEKENESLREKLEIAQQDSIRLEQLEKIRKDDILWRDKAMEQQRKDAAEIQELKSHIEFIE